MRGYQICYNQGIITIFKAKEMLIMEVKKSDRVSVSCKRSNMYLSGIHQTWKRFSLDRQQLSGLIESCIIITFPLFEKGTICTILKWII